MTPLSEHKYLPLLAVLSVLRAESHILLSRETPVPRRSVCPEIRRLLPALAPSLPCLASHQAPDIMSFHISAQNISVQDNHILRASLQNADGEFVDAEFDLDTCIGNSNG